jgi:hypothetical protein
VQFDENEIIGEIEPGIARRFFATGAMGLLGMIVLYLAATNPPAHLGWLAVLLVIGLGCICLSWLMWQASAMTLELTQTELRERDGRLLCKISNVASVDRGFFAFKPSNGFIIRLKTRGTRVIAPGLWWRAGKSLAVGGMTPGSQAKSVADLITILLVERDVRDAR